MPAFRTCRRRHPCFRRLFGGCRHPNLWNADFRRTGGSEAHPARSRRRRPLTPSLRVLRTRMASSCCLRAQGSYGLSIAGPRNPSTAIYGIWPGNADNPMKPMGIIILPKSDWSFDCDNSSRILLKRQGNKEVSYLPDQKLIGFLEQNYDIFCKGGMFRRLICRVTQAHLSTWSIAFSPPTIKSFWRNSTFCGSCKSNSVIWEISVLASPIRKSSTWPPARRSSVIKCR
jgi:hypothetical protein